MSKLLKTLREDKFAALIASDGNLRLSHVLDEMERLEQQIAALTDEDAIETPVDEDNE